MGPTNARAALIRKARAADREAIRRFLERDPVVNILPLTRLDRDESPVDAFLVAERRHRGQPAEVVGVCLMQGKMALPVASELAMARAFGARLAHSPVQLEHVLGERPAVTAFWQPFRELGLEPRLDRLQRFFVLDSAPVATSSCPVRHATSLDFEALVEAAAAMYLEEVLVDPLLDRAAVFRYLVQRRIDQGRAFVWMDDAGRVIFKADISSSTAQGVLLAGIYTRPDLRRQGIARRALATLCEHLLTVVDRLALYVNDDNTAAIELYEGLGFREHKPYRSIFVT